MRIADAKIYLAQPLFGRRVLTGPVIVSTTWLDYTFNEPISSQEMGLSDQPEGEELTIVRTLIPLNNVLAVVVEQQNVLETNPRPGTFLQAV